MLVATAIPFVGVASPAVAQEPEPTLMAQPPFVEVIVSPLLMVPPTEAPGPMVDLCVTLTNPTSEPISVRGEVQPTEDTTEHVQAWFEGVGADAGTWVDAIGAGYFGDSAGFTLAAGETREFWFYVFVDAPYDYQAEFQLFDSVTNEILSDQTVIFTGLEGQMTIAELLTADEEERFTTLLSLVEAAGLTGLFADETIDPVTLFAPTNAAFAALAAEIGQEALDAIVADTELLTAILAYHVLPDAYPASVFIEQAGPTEYTTLQGETITVEFTEGEVVINGYAMVIEPNLMASNGIVHVIDAVLLPELVEEPLLPVRLAGANRYSTAIDIAEEAYPGFEGVTDVVIASGADRSAVDALSAAGLTGVLDAPLLLVRPTSVPDEVRAAIAGMPENVRLHIVGGPAAVSNAVRDQLAGISGVTAVHRISGADRYQTARAVASEMNSILVARGDSLPNVALLANGAQRRSFFDAMALSAISAANNFPILLLQQNAIPSATAAALAERNLTTRIVAGGTAVVSASVFNALNAPAGATAERWAGADRYATAATVATNAVARGWSTFEVVGVAATLPDALTGGSAVGSMGGVLLLTRTTSVPDATANVLTANADDIEAIYVFGGPVVVSPAVVLQLEVLAGGGS
jgi:uncharacterized surface protein with fasciclin (FAS1) repeats/putative cell wall-binding protein